MKRLNRVYMARHGQVAGYDKVPVYGHTDVEITDVGIIQMEHLAERLRLTDIKAIYSSDLQRTVEGARSISRHHNAPLYAMPELREMYFGDWEGLNLTEIRERFPDELDKREADLVNYRIPGDGESIGSLSKRVMACLQKVLEDQKGKDILLVGHGGVNRVILCNALGLDLNRMFTIQQDYGCLNIIDYYRDSTLVRLING
ncbi:MAG: histidine phosphatase family protein [Thermodesulfobacteriota bacterium]|nr:histidine phosphatase family protein [Thermodesulfobacteriota bacterium]